jgi:hypothetical protein
MGGFMPPEPDPTPVESGEGGSAEALHRIEILGRFIIRQIRQLERQMAERNYTTQEILNEVRAQKSEIASMSALLGSMKVRLNAALAGEISPKGQAILNDIMSELQGNSRALVNAQVNNDDDPNNDVDVETGEPINRPAPTPETGPAPVDQGDTPPLQNPAPEPVATQDEATQVGTGNTAPTPNDQPQEGGNAAPAPQSTGDAEKAPA